MAEFANLARIKPWTAKRIPTPTNHSQTQYSHIIDLITFITNSKVFFDAFDGELMPSFYCLIFVSVC